MQDTIYFIGIYGLTFAASAVAVGWLTAIAQDLLEAYENRYVASVSRSLSAMFIFQDPRRLFFLNIIITLFFLLVAVALTRNPITIALLTGIGFSIPRVLIWRARQKRLEQFAQQLVDGLTVLSNALRSGQNLIQSLETLEVETGPPISQEFGLVMREYRVGVNIEAALENLVKRVPNEDLKLMVTAINVVLAQGGNLAEIFESIAKVIRERNKLEGKTKALTSQGKLQGVIVGLLPTFLGGIMYVMDPITMRLMFTTLVGNISLVAMVILQVVGYLLIRKVINIEI
ncbi:MAG: type II secretion system F family protein [Desulfosarcinaceae bacterium]|nr:type II secretion system F family protein [Desulfosarcinaceae bacterium]